MVRWTIVGILLAGFVGLDAAPARLTAHDRAQGWRLLFDGVGFSGWHAYGARRAAANWSIREGALVAREEGRALVTDESFADFELSFSWRVEAEGRAEVYFRVAEDGELPAQSAPVFQLAGPDVESGGNGGLSRLDEPFVASPETWHRARLVVTGEVVEHWLQDRLVLSYRLGSPEWRAALPGTRYAKFRDYARGREGGIALAGRGVQFRDLKVRPL